MVKVARVEATITAQNRLRPGLASASAELNRFRATQTRAMSALGAAAGRVMLGFGSAFAGQATARGLAEATKRFAGVERAMARTGITGDATVEQTRKGTIELRNLARETGILFDPAQKGLDAITASGRDFAEAMTMMPSVLRTAQASGAGVDEIANSSTALIDHMKIAVEGLAEAQDTLAMGGKLGKFELKDMARYLPSMLPAFKALGAEGQGGLRQLVAMLQVIRAGTGTAEEAASSASNVFQKMESEETTKRFAKFGVDLRKEMAKARKEGKNLVEVFVELSNKAVKGDLSKLPQLFSDMELARGMRALMGGMDKYRQYLAELQNSRGTMATDFKRISEDAQGSIDRFSEAADRARTAIGELAAETASPLLKSGAATLDGMAQSMERAAEAARKGGFTGAVKAMAEELGTKVVAEVSQHNQGFADFEDSEKLAAIAGRASERRERDGLAGRDPASLSRHEVARLHVLRRRRSSDRPGVTEDEAGAWSRDQLRRLGPLPGSERIDADMAGIVEAARESRRGQAFSGLGRTGGKGGVSFPLPRPADLTGTTFPAFGLDDAAAKAGELRSTVEAIGPAAEAAGARLSTGLSGATDEIQSLAAAVSSLVNALNSIRVPNLSGAGASGLNTGKQGPN